MPLVEHASRARRRQRDELGDRAGTALLREPDQREQDLRGRLRIGKRAMARLHRGAEEVRELCERCARHTPGKHTPRERDRVDDGCSEPRPGQPLRLAVEKREVEPRVVRDEHASPAKRMNRCTAAGARGAPRSCRSVSPVIAVIVAPSGVPGSTSVSNSSTSSKPTILTAPISQICGGARAQPCRLEVDDDVGRLLEQEVDAERARERDRVAVPREPRVGLDDLREKRARERDRRLAEREEPAGRLLGDDRPPPLLDELHEAVGGV